MSCCCRETRLSYRDKTCAKAILATLFVLAIPGSAQEPEPAGPSAPEQRPLPIGFEVNGVSAYVGGDALRIPNAAGDSTGPGNWLASSGAAADVAWHSGRLSQVSVEYHGSYSYNSEYSPLRGFNHTVSIDIRTDPTRRTTFSILALGESGLVYDAVFGASQSLTVAQQAPSADQLANGLRESSAGTILNSPLNLAFSGARRTSGAAYAELTHLHNRRLTSFVRIVAIRELHSYSQTQQFESAFPSVTVGTMNFGLNFSASTRTRITWNGDYSRSYGRLYRSAWESSGLEIQRLMGRRSFVSLQAGFTRFSDVSAAGSTRNSYNAGAAMGTSKGYHTLTAVFRRGISNTYGLGADSLIGFDGAWVWAPHAISWTLRSSVGYERLQGAGVGMVQSLVYQANAVHRVSGHLQIVFSAVYLTNSNRSVAGVASPSFRISCLWTPARPLTR